MKRLILMRHAKSSWDEPGLSDHDRPLNVRGVRSARAVGDWMRIHKHIPDQCLSSPSIRTRETFEGLGLSCPVQYIPSLYHASGTQIFKEVLAAEGSVVLVIGHNPGIAELAWKLLETPLEHPRFDEYPTCATLVAELAITCWSELELGTGQPVEFVTPRELTE